MRGQALSMHQPSQDGSKHNKMKDRESSLLLFDAAAPWLLSTKHRQSSAHPQNYWPLIDTCCRLADQVHQVQAFQLVKPHMQCKCSGRHICVVAHMQRPLPGL